VSASADRRPAGRDAPDVRDADSAQIGAWFAARGLRVLTFLGYSDAGYEDPAAMLAHAGRVLDAFDPAGALVSIGATPGGIGAVYALAKSRGFTTVGIVSSQAREAGVALADDVDVVFYVADAAWGGYLPGSSTQLSPTSQAVVEHSDLVVAIGGGAVARDELDAAMRLGKPTRFIPAQMNHAAARAAAARKGLDAPVDFRGAAGERFGAD
jgi:predicted Rossmann-fold nucleotide-binding protein